MAEYKDWFSGLDDPVSLEGPWTTIFSHLANSLLVLFCLRVYLLGSLFLREGPGLFIPFPEFHGLVEVLVVIKNYEFINFQKTDKMFYVKMWNIIRMYYWFFYFEINNGITNNSKL